MDTHWRRLRLTLLTGIAFLLAALLSQLISSQGDGPEALWLGSAIILGVLMVASGNRPDTFAITAGGALGSILFHLAEGYSALFSVGLSLANVVQAGLAFTLLRSWSHRGGLFNRVSDVVALIVACLCSSAAAATIGAPLVVWTDGAHLLTAWFGWFGQGVLSQLMIAPMIVICARPQAKHHARAIAAHTLAEVILFLGLTALVTIGVFLWTDLPLLFLVMPAVLLATFRLRAFGAVGAVAIVGVIAAYLTTQGQGPLAAAVSDAADRMMLLELFLSCCFLTALPLAAMLTERDLRAHEARMIAEQFRAVVENIGEVIYRIDTDARWAYLNPAWEPLTGQSIERSLGRPWTELIDEADRAELQERLERILAGEANSARRTLRFATASGTRWIELFVHALCDGEGTIVGATGTLRDIDDRKRLEEHVMTAKRRAEQRAREATLLASTDELTGIANRRAFMQQLEREMAGAAEFGWPLAVAMFDVDHFKSINDRYGHGVGDQVLQLIAERAGAAIRGGDLVGRLGGEEFGILMPGATAEDASIVAERLRVAIEEQRGSELPAVTVSIGIAEREGLRDADAVLRAADAALYAAKDAGRNRIRIAA